MVFVGTAGAWVAYFPDALELNDLDGIQPDPWPILNLQGAWCRKLDTWRSRSWVMSAPILMGTWCDL